LVSVALRFCGKEFTVREKLGVLSPVLQGGSDDMHFDPPVAPVSE
jgi:hypothetical protein